MITRRGFCVAAAALALPFRSGGPIYLCHWSEITKLVKPESVVLLDGDTLTLAAPPSARPAVIVAQLGDEMPPLAYALRDDGTVKFIAKETVRITVWLTAIEVS